MWGDMGIAPQRTLRAAAACRGIGLHCGKPVTMRMRPAPPDAGIVFRRIDAGAEIRALWSSTCESNLSTVLSNGEGIRVGTIEHLMAAFAGCGIDNAVVEIDGPEVPIMDGSAAPFVYMIERAGIVPQDAARRAIKILKPVTVNENGASAELLPEHGFSMSFEIDYDNPLIRRQDIKLNFEPGTFEAELAPARTFGLIDDLPRLQAAGLALGGSLDNAVVVSGSRVLNQGGLRYADEFVRHKLLDAVGDLYLAGAPIIGHFRGLRSGHALTRRLLATLFADRNAWCETTMAEAGWIDRIAWPQAETLAPA
jgi:UDP-3-O-[3-hydroxymyristoyl] N-acetylglucosamine deacetylase